MEEVFEKIMDYLSDLHEMYINQCGVVGSNIGASAISRCKEIIKNAAEEYKGGWIPCSERLPDKRDWYLAVFQEVDTGFIGLPYIADYLMGEHTNFTTEDGWIIANCTDIEEGRAEYYKKLKCIAWQPLPEPYKGE